MFVNRVRSVCDSHLGDSRRWEPNAADRLGRREWDDLRAVVYRTLPMSLSDGILKSLHASFSKHHMGLQEKRGIEDFKSNVYPEIEKEITKLLGDDVTVEVDWDSLIVEDKAEYYADWFKKIYFDPLIGALKAVAADDMGKEALKETVKKIVVRNTTENSSYYNWTTLEDGVLTLDCLSDTNADRASEREESLRTMLEKAL